MKPTREQIARTIAWNMILRFDHSAGIDPEKYEISIKQLSDELVTYQKKNVIRLGYMLSGPSAIIGLVIGYIIAASLLILSLGGLMWAAKMAIRMVAG